MSRSITSTTLVILILVAIAAALAGCGTATGSQASESEPTAQVESQSTIVLMPRQSFCIPTGIDDVYTGDGHVTFYITVKNTGDADGSIDVTPVRHYSDGDSNESVMDMVSIDVAAGAVEKVHTDAMKYKAHEHEVVNCGLQATGNPERPIKLIG